MHGVITSKFKNHFSSPKSPSTPPNDMGNHLVIDIGASKTLVALFSRRGRVVSRCKFNTAHGSKTFLDMLERNLRPYKDQQIQSLVIAVPGVVQKNYTVRFGNRSWGDFDILTPIKKLFKCPIHLINDADAAAFYEAKDLPGRNVFLTFSTGIGGSVMRDDHLLRINFEPGHKTYSYLGKTAEWEDIASANAIDNFYHIDRINSLHGQDAFRDVAARVALGLPDIVKRFNPTTIIIGGPMAYIFNRILPFLPEFEGVTYRAVQHPGESVINGGYIYALRQNGTLLPKKTAKKSPKTSPSRKQASAAQSTTNKNTPSATSTTPFGFFKNLPTSFSLPLKPKAISKTSSQAKLSSPKSSSHVPQPASRSLLAQFTPNSSPQKKARQSEIRPSVFRKKSSRTPIQVSLPKRVSENPPAKDNAKSKAKSPQPDNTDAPVASLSDFNDALSAIPAQVSAALKTLGRHTSKTVQSLLGHPSKK